MKTDILTYITNSLVKQKGVNLLMGIALGVCFFKISKLDYQVQALKSEVKGETE